MSRRRLVVGLVIVAVVSVVLDNFFWPPPDVGLAILADRLPPR